jgi:hypothetical protein
MAFKVLGQMLADVSMALVQLWTGDWKNIGNTLKDAFATAGDTITTYIDDLDAILAEKTKATGDVMAKNYTEPVIRSMSDINAKQKQEKKKDLKDEAKLQNQASKEAWDAQQRALEEYKKLQEAKIQASGEAWNAISSLSESGNATLGAIGKASAIRTAIMDAYVAINKTMASVPFPLNLIASASIGATAFANVQAIRGVAHGGLANVPQEGTYILQEGEGVLSPQANKAYQDGSGGGLTMIKLILDGRELAKGLADLKRKGILQVALT